MPVVPLTIGLLSVLRGAAIYGSSPQYPDLSKAIEGALLRLTDPGYLGDAEGTIPRTTSMLFTVAGYVLFLGLLVAIMTNWLKRFVDELSSGLSPLSEKEHVLIIGWNARSHG